MQAGRGFVKDEERLFALAFESIGKVLGEFETLSFAAGQGRNRLAELEIVQADFNERLEIAHDFLVFFEEVESFGNRHIEHFGNVFTLVAHLERSHCGSGCLCIPGSLNTHRIRTAFRCVRIRFRSRQGNGPFRS